MLTSETLLRGPRFDREERLPLRQWQSTVDWLQPDRPRRRRPGAIVASGRVASSVLYMWHATVLL
jgi:hypothetical protein